MQDIRRHSVDVQLCFTGEANQAKVLALVFEVELGEGKNFVNAVGAPEKGAEVALSNLLLKLLFRLATHTARILLHH